jgi:putative ABC transport system permease protein
MRRVPVAWLQLTHEKRRFAAAVAGVTFAVALMLMQLGLRAVLYRAATRIPEHLAGDLVMISPRYEYLYALTSFSEHRLYSALAVRGVTSVAPMYIEMGLWRHPSTRQAHRIFVIGVPTGTNVFDLPDLRRRLPALRVPDTVLFDAGSRPEFGPVADLLAHGPELVTELNDRAVRVAGLFDLGATFGAGGHVVTSDVTFGRLFRRPVGMIDIGVISLARGSDAGAVQRALRAVLPHDVAVMTRSEFAAQEAAYWSRRAAIGFIFDLGAAMGLLVGAVIVYQILYTDVTDHLDEYATLKAIGYHDRYLYSIVLQESLVLSALGLIPGFAIAETLYLMFRHQAHVPVEMTMVRVAFVIALTIAMCVGAGMMAMRRLRDADPAEIF